MSAALVLLAACSGGSRVPSPPAPPPAAAAGGATPPPGKGVAIAPPADAGAQEASGDAGSKVATLPPKAPIFQPSSGKELPKPPIRPPLSNDFAKKTLSDALTRARDPKLDCEKVLFSSAVAEAFYVARPSKALIVQDGPAYVRLARCAEKRGYFVFMLDLAKALSSADPKGGHPELIARAQLGLSDEKAAIDLLEKLLKERPNDPFTRVTAAKAQCAIKSWATCASHAQLATTMNVTAPEEKLPVMARAQKYLARAQLHLGKIDEADRARAAAEKAGADKDDIDELKELIAVARMHKVLIEVDEASDLPLGVYHLYGKVQDNGDPVSLVTIHVTNVGPKDIQVRLESEVAGITQRSTQTLTVLKGESTTTRFSPPMRNDFDRTAIRAEQTSQLDVLAVSGDKTLYQHSFTMRVQPRDLLPRRRWLDKQRTKLVVMDGYFGAWITPNARPVDAFLTEAKALAPKHSFVGEQGPTVPQVKAIFETLKAKNMSYVMDPEAMLEGHLAQRTRLPTEVLASSNAQCLEGALTYATLFEAIGLRPVIVRVPGHAFVGWHPSPTDAKSDAPQGLYYLETTMTHSATFEEAIKRGADQVAMHQAQKRFTFPASLAPAAIVEISTLRRHGFSPQPIE